MTVWNFLLQVDTSSGLLFVIIRCIIVYIYAIALVRLTNRFHLETTFDFVVIVIIGAVLGRTIYSGTSLISTIVASFVLILLHKLFAILSFHSDFFGRMVKGKSIILFKNGLPDTEQMRKTQVTEADILESCRKQLHVNDLNSVKEVRLERSGSLSLIDKE